VEFIRKYPDEIEQLRQLLENREANKTKIEESPVGNRERRRQKLRERKPDAPTKKTVLKVRSVAAPYGSEIDRQALFAFYHDDEEEVVICQICCDPMPFVRSNGEDSAECVDLLSKKWADATNYELKVMTPLKLVLCPVCSEIYRDYVQNDVEKQNVLFHHILSGNEDDFRVCDETVRRDHKDTTLKFNHTHLGDIRDCLQKDDDDDDVGIN